MTHDYCEKCGACVPMNQLGEVRMMAATHLSPAETARWCEHCRQPEPEWDEHERDAAFARGNDFQRSGGRDWT